MRTTNTTGYNRPTNAGLKLSDYGLQMMLFHLNNRTKESLTCLMHESCSSFCAINKIKEMKTVKLVAFLLLLSVY